MKISEKWAITGRSGDFVLTESSVRKDPKTGVEKISESHTYHPNLEQCLNKIIREESSKTLTTSDGLAAEDLKRFLTQLKVDIKDIADAAQTAV